MVIAIDVSPIDGNSKSGHKVRGVGKYIFLLKENLEKYDKKNKYIFSNSPASEAGVDLVHYPYLDPFFVTFPFVKRRKTIITVHDLIPLMHKTHFPAGLRGSLSWQVNKIILKRADAIISDSKASAQDIAQVTGIAKEKINPIYLGIDPKYKKLRLDEFQAKEIKSKYKLPDNFFLYVGDITWNKNLPRLIEAIKIVNVPLVLVGKAIVDDFDPDNLWNRDRTIVKKETISPLFIKTGFVDEEDLIKLYNLALAVCMPSLDEGFGLPVLEGLSCGAIVIASREGSLPEVAGDAALYVDAYKVGSIAEKLKLVAKGKVQKKEFSKKALAQAENFSIKSMIENTVKCYESI